MSTSESAKMIQQQGRIKTFEITRKLPQPYEVPRFTKKLSKNRWRKSKQLKNISRQKCQNPAIVELDHAVYTLTNRRPLLSCLAKKRMLLPPPQRVHCLTATPHGYLNACQPACLKACLPAKHAAATATSHYWPKHVSVARWNERVTDGWSKHTAAACSTAMEWACCVGATLRRQSLRRREVRRSEPPNCLSHGTLNMLPAHLLRGFVVQPPPPLLPPSRCHLPPSTLMLLLEAQCVMYLSAP